MRKEISITILFLMTCITVFSQQNRKFDEIEKQEFEQKIVENSQKIATLQCTFVQEKTSSLFVEKAVAKGILSYQSPSMLRWEYTEPSPSTLIINGNDAILLDRDGNKMGNEKMLKQLGGIIISMINGSGIVQNRQFSSELYPIDHAQILVVLTPLQKRLKDFYTQIELTIDLRTMLAHEILLVEVSGDKMVIFLTNKVLNSDFSQNIFAIK